jgi:hypothetical protein
VAGKSVAGNRDFRIEIPGEYAVLSEHGNFLGALDGTRYAGPRFLAASGHTLTSNGVARTAVVWQRAAALGFSPFITDRRCREEGVVP